MTGIGCPNPAGTLFAIESQGICGKLLAPKSLLETPFEPVGLM
jgi:hypothetical protein